MGRDHTGVGNFYSPTASHDIFDQFTDLGITPIKFGQVFYSKKLKAHVHEWECPNHDEEDKLFISGTRVREMLSGGERPPDWFMRSEIVEILVEATENGDAIFID